MEKQWSHIRDMSSQLWKVTKLMENTGLPVSFMSLTLTNPNPKITLTLHSRLYLLNTSCEDTTRRGDGRRQQIAAMQRAALPFPGQSSGFLGFPNQVSELRDLLPEPVRGVGSRGRAGRRSGSRCL